MLSSVMQVHIIMEEEEGRKNVSPEIYFLRVISMNNE